MASAAAQALCEAGARAILAGPHEDRPTTAAERLARDGHGARHVVIGAIDAAACDAASARLNTDSGGVDIIIANPGIARQDAAAEDIADEVRRQALDVDLDRTFRTCRAFGRPMPSRRSGTVVLVGSMSGLIANRPRRQAACNASKAGMHHLAWPRAGEWAD